MSSRRAVTHRDGAFYSCPARYPWSASLGATDQRTGSYLGRAGGGGSLQNRCESQGGSSTENGAKPLAPRSRCVEATRRPAGERDQLGHRFKLKHGPLALIGKGTPVNVVDNNNPNIAEIKARGGRLTMIGSASSTVNVVGNPYAPRGPLESRCRCISSLAQWLWRWDTTSTSHAASPSRRRWSEPRTRHLHEFGLEQQL